MATTTPEMPDAIVDYITYLEDPDSLLPADKIAAVEQRLADGNLTKLETLQAKLELGSLKSVDDAPLVDAFVKAAPKYIAEWGVDLDYGREMFKEAGVPADVLNSLHAAPVKKNGRVSVDDVLNVITKSHGEFGKQDLINRTGAGSGTVDKALKSAKDKGLIKDQGGNPKTYRRQK